MDKTKLSMKPISALTLKEAVSLSHGALRARITQEKVDSAVANFASAIDQYMAGLISGESALKAVGQPSNPLTLTPLSQADIMRAKWEIQREPGTMFWKTADGIFAEVKVNDMMCFTPNGVFNMSRQGGPLQAYAGCAVYLYDNQFTGRLLPRSVGQSLKIHFPFNLPRDTPALLCNRKTNVILPLNDAQASFYLDHDIPKNCGILYRHS